MKAIICINPHSFGTILVDGDEKITSTDARLILQYSVKLIDKFPVEE